MTVEQTVDWATPTSVAALECIHLQAAWSLRRLFPLGLLLVLGTVEWLTLHTIFLFIAAGGVAVLIVFITRVVHTRLRRVTLASGVSTHRLDDVLHIQNALGMFEISLIQVDVVRSYPAGLIVQYAGTSSFTLPNGPVRAELERRFKTRS